MTFPVTKNFSGVDPPELSLWVLPSLACLWVPAGCTLCPVVRLQY